MINFFILFLWNVFCLPSKPKANALEKQKLQEHNNDNNQRLVRELMRLKFMRLKLSHICPGLDHVFYSCARKSVFSTAELKLNLKNTILPT